MSDHVVLDTDRKDATMAQAKLKGLAKQVAGDAQQALGKLTGSKTTAAKGKVKTGAGKTQETAGKAKGKAKKLTK